MSSSDPEFDQDRHERLKRVFLDALEVPVGRRAAFIAEACEGDEQMRREVLELFLVHGELGDRMDTPLDGAEAIRGLAEPGGETFGPFRLLAELGRGSMGIVKLAERDGQVVALKLLSTGSLSPEARERFQLESRILRRLDHPGLARLLDSGETETELGVSQPWIAMEYVEGEPLLRHAEARRLTVRGRLQLMIAVCDALDHVHRQDIVHRDLKPGHIQVRRDGRPVVLDFGIAVLVRGDERPSEFVTRTGQLVGTLQYMSPEQVQADPAVVGPASDVYSLGIILYELLSGRVPYEASSNSLHRAVVAVLTVEPVPLGRVAPGLRGPIERVVSKALEKNPRHRYADAGALAADLRRLVHGQPVRARGPGLLRRVARWSLARQRTVAWAGAAIAVLAVLGAWVLGSGQAVPRTRVLETYRQAEMLAYDVDALLYQGERTPERMRHVIEMLTRARSLLGSVPRLPHHNALMRRIEKDLGTAQMLLGQMTWDIGAARAAVVTLEHALTIRVREAPDLFRDQQVAELGASPVPREELYSILSTAELITYRLWGQSPSLMSALGHAHLALEDIRRELQARPGPSPEVRDHLEMRKAYAFNALTEVGWEVSAFRWDVNAARAAAAWSDSAYRRSAAFGNDWPAHGSLLFQRSRAYEWLGRLSGSASYLDTADTYLRECVLFRGPERPRAFAGTRQAVANLTVLRVNHLPREERPLRLQQALAALDSGITALRDIGTIRPILGSLDGTAVDVYLTLARVDRSVAWLDSASKRLESSAATLPSTSYPRQASFVWLRRGLIAGERARLSGRSPFSGETRADFAHARALAAARGDSLVLHLAALDERDLAGEPLAPFD